MVNVMKPSIDVGIYGYGAYIPRFFLENKVISGLWGRDSQPIQSKSFPNYDEDTITIAYEAALRAIESSKAPRDKIGAIFIGSESKPYAVKPSGTVLVDALGLPRKILSADYEFACKAGTEAMQTIFGLVSSGMIEMGIAIGADTAQGRPGDELEYTAAAGGAAYIISRADMGVLARLEASYSYVSDTPDFWRRSGEDYPRHLYRFTGEPAYFHHIISSVSGLFEQYGYKPSDFKYAVFHQPNYKFPVRVAAKLGFNKDQIKPGLVVALVGNTYSGSSLLGFASTLDVAEPGDRILLASFGSGAGSDAMVFEVTDLIEERRMSPPVSKLIERMSPGDYSKYAVYREMLKR